MRTVYFRNSPRRAAIVAGTVRQSTENRARWYYIDDEAHAAVNVMGEYAEASGEVLTIRYAQTYKRIITFVVVPDESFGALGYVFGASVNRDRAHIKSNIGVLDGTDDQQLHGGNIWFYGLFEV